MSELEDLERAGWDALCGPDGATYYEEHMADDGLMVFPGMVMDKKTSISTIESVEPWAAYELVDVREVMAGDVGVITYSASARRRAQPYAATMTSVYLRRDGQWRLLLHQQSPSD